MSKNKEKSSIGKKIIKGLTEKQLVSLLDGVFSSLDKEKTKKIISKLENDIAKTLMEIIYPIKKEVEKM